MTVVAPARSRVVILVLGGAAILLLAVVMIATIASRRRSGREPAAAGANARETARPPAGGKAARSHSLDALRQGRFGEVFTAHARPDAAPLSADELTALGMTLLERDRLVLGWAALEAARRVEPRHVAARQGLDALEGKLALATGRELAARREAADQVEFLRAVRGGPPLGLLVLGLAQYTDDKGREREAIDRLLIRDRGELRAIETPAGATFLLARLLMESSRPALALELLRPLAEASASSASSAVTPAAGREASWLLSRAALQLDQRELAETMLERAGGFGASGASPEPSPFIGSRKCAECHPSYYRAAQQASPHARTLYLGAALKDVPLPDRPVPDPLDPHVVHAFTRKADDRIDLETRDEKGRVARAVIAYAFGSGEHGVTMVSRDEPGGTPRELRISYYTVDRSWRETKGVNALPHDTTDFIGLELSDKSLRQCLQCHTTWFRAALPIAGEPARPEAADRGIGCERCHGPGLNHVKAIEADYPESAIGATHDSPPRRLLRSCNECHASNGSVEPSDPEFTRVQGTTLMFSKCFTASQGAIHCATCHDPHRGLDTRTAHYEPKCLACHDTKTAANHAGPPICPVNATSGCIDCHMPKVADPSLKMRFTDHHIRIHRQTPAAAAGGQ